MVRQEMIDRHGDAAYTDGFNVHTTLRAGHQQQANRALRLALVEYDLRHGYRGPEQRPVEGGSPPSLATIPTLGGLLPARVTALDETSISVEIKDHGPALIESEGWEWAQPYLSENRRGKKPTTPDQVVAVGDLVRVRLDDEERWWLTQLPAIEGAMVALRPDDGAIRRRDHGPGRWLRFPSQQVQPCGPGAASAGFGIQAGDLLSGTRTRLHHGEPDQRRTGGV
jgi:penicillin-binding protein 1A